MLTDKEYKLAAKIIRDRLNDPEQSDAYEHGVIVEAFIEFFKQDNPEFHIVQEAVFVDECFEESV